MLWGTKSKKGGKEIKAHSTLYTPAAQEPVGSGFFGGPGTFEGLKNHGHPGIPGGLLAFGGPGTLGGLDTPEGPQIGLRDFCGP
jgi:hypothetical protein